MRRLSILALALASAGCSIVLAPDRDAIVPFTFDGGPDDAGFDGGDVGPDAGDAGFDGGDGGFDAGPCEARPGYQEVEVTCNDGEDNDCDGLSDCDDPQCGTNGYCCDAAAGGGWGALETNYGVWPRFGTARITASRLGFGTGTGQLIHPTCAPLAYGMRVGVSFARTGLGNPGDYAALVLAPVDMPRGDGTLLTDLAIRVGHDGMVTLERAGSPIGEPMGPIPAAGTVPALISLTPGVDDLGRAVLLVTAEVGTHMLADQVPVMPLSDLIRGGGCANGDGLFLGFDGHGAAVEVALTPGVAAMVGDCDNPTQFLADPAGPLATDGLTPGTWRAGGAGEPALATTGSPTTQLDLLVDASEDERGDEIFRFIDYTIGGAIYTRATGWTARTSGPSGGPSLLPPSAREPSYAEGHVAFARRMGAGGDVYEIAIAALGPAADEAVGTVRSVLGPGGECVSVRDPALISLDGDLDGTGFLLFYTCERAGAPSRLGVARIVRMGGVFMVMDDDPSLLDASVGGYARQGVSSPEAVASPAREGSHGLRLWFLARDASGRVRVAFAYGDVAPGALPSVTAYPGNPILEPDDQALAGDCMLGCAIDSLAVTATRGTSSLWSPPIPPSYVFLIERSRFRADGVDHQLIPLRQPRPSDG